MPGEQARRKHDGCSFWCSMRERFLFACCLLLGSATEGMDDCGAIVSMCTAVVHPTFDQSSLFFSKMREGDSAAYVSSKFRTAWSIVLL